MFFIEQRLLGHTECYLNIIMFRVQFTGNGCKQTGFPLSCYASVEVTGPDKEELDVLPWKSTAIHSLGNFNLILIQLPFLFLLFFVSTIPSNTIY